MQGGPYEFAGKAEFPYLRGDSGHLFEFDQGWLREAITKAADRAGYPSWWLTDHITESITFYLRLRNDESVVAVSQLSQTVQYVLKVIGYREIIPHFRPEPPPITLSLFDIAQQAGAGYELAFFEDLGHRIDTIVRAGVPNLRVSSIAPSVKHLRGTKIWTRSCDALRSEIVIFIREKLTNLAPERPLECSIR